jgi:small-conductance mechanosensitive channel
VLADPPPKAYLSGFADSGVDLELGFWIGDPQEGTLNVKSDINLAIWHAFHTAGVEIPYPQREVRLLNPAAAELPRAV